MASDHISITSSSFNGGTAATTNTSSSSSSSQFPKKLFINIPTDTTKVELGLLLKPYGNIKDLYIPIDLNNNKTGNKNRGFAFVTFSWSEDAQLALETLDGTSFQGLILHPQWASQPNRSNNNKKKDHANKKTNQPHNR